jgi:1A family penicillin-binding protein
MPGENSQISESKKRILLYLLLFPWALIKIGSLVIFLFKFSFKNLIKLSLFLGEAFRVVYQSYVPHLSAAKLPRVHHKRRGRPRKAPYYIYFLRKVGKGFKRFLPSPLRLGIAIGVIALLFFGYSFFLVNVAHNLPSPQSLSEDHGPITTEFYDRNGKLLYRLYEGKNRTLAKLSDLPPYFVNATIAIEDKNYWGHPGVDITGITRALISDSRNESIQGGSTITQQLIKNTLLTPDRTWQRKVKEVFLSFWAERIFTKQQILEMYFNQVGYGGPAWGVEAASQTYFGKSAKDLNLAESAYLAGLPASPTSYSPYGPHPELGKQRQAEVLRRMVEDKYISQAEANAALAEKVTFKAPISNIKAPHFVMYVRDLLVQKYGEKTVAQGGLRVYTSLDLETQVMAEQVVADEVAKLADLNVSNGAAMIVDPRNGQVLAMVGSKNYFDEDGGNFNVALAERQPGSSIKPITYATAFKQGYSPGTMILDAPVVFRNAWETYAPVNYDSRWHGMIPIRTALGSSYNIPAVKMLNAVGISNMIQTAHDLGITTLNDTNRYGLSLTLGGGEIKLIDMMSVYSTFSQLGMKHEITPVLKVTDSKGEVLEDNSDSPGVRVLSAGISYLVTDILADNKARTPAFGPNSLLVIPDHTVAVKTGTTDSKRDNWTFGYTPEIAVGVWVGNNNNEPMNPALTSGVTGAAPIWNRLMVNVLKDKPNLAFVRPADVVDGIVDGHKDLVLSNMPTQNFANTKPKEQTPPTPGIISLTEPLH